jgi:hypothetical protein
MSSNIEFIQVPSDLILSQIITYSLLIHYGIRAEMSKDALTLQYFLLYTLINFRNLTISLQGDFHVRAHRHHRENRTSSSPGPR